MQPTTSQFLQQLVEQLSEDSLHSIYLNAAPQRQWTRLDITALDQWQEQWSGELMQMLLGRAQFNLAFPSVDGSAGQALEKRLWSILFENKDYQEEHGRGALGLGFPLLVMRDPKQPSRLLQAPLFIWSLELEQQQEQWFIRRSLGGSILTNKSLAAFLKQRGQVVHFPHYDHLLNDGILDKEELAQLVHQFLQQLQPTLSKENRTFFRELLEQPLQPVRTAEELAAMPLEQASIVWSGVLGLYRHHKTALLEDTLLLKEQWPQLQPLLTQERNPEDPSRSAFMKHSFTCMNTDPCQQQLLHDLSKGKDILLQSPPGTGRSQTLGGILYNVLSNAGTCLVVSDKHEALSSLQAAFEATNLGELCLLVEDPYQAPTAVVQSVWTRARLRQAPYQVAPSFIRLLQSCAAYVQHLQGFFKKMHTPMLGEETWTDVVGRLLAQAEALPSSSLNQYLETRQFKYTQHEFEDIMRLLPEGEALYKDLGRFKHPLNALNDRFFETANAVQMETLAQEAISKVLTVVQGAQRDAFAYLFEYEQLIDKHLSKVYTTKMSLVEQIVNGIQGGLSKDSYHFNKSDGLYRKFMKRISDKHKALEEEKVRLLEAFFKLQRYHQKYDYFTYKFLDTSRSASLAFKDLLEHVNEYKTNLYEWFEGRQAGIQQIVKDLSPRRIYPHVSFERQVRALSSNLDAFERNFGSSRVFKVKFAFVTANLRKRITQIEQLEHNLQQLQGSFEDFKAFHAFKFFWLSLNTQQQTVLQALTQAEVNDWPAAFSHWYLKALLAQQENEYVPTEQRYQDNKQAFLQEHQALQGRMEQHTLEYWRGKQTQAVQAFHQAKAPLTLGALYNPQIQQHNLAHLVKTDPDLFLSFYPVLMVSPAVAATILPLHPHLFDVVVVEQANQLPVREVFSVLARGRYKIIVGDDQQLPTPEQLQPATTTWNQEQWPLQEQLYSPLSPTQQQLNQLSSSPSLWHYTQLLHHYQERQLLLHYRARHQGLIDFSNTAFYKGKLKPIAVQATTKPCIIMKPVTGVCEQGENLQEIEALLAYLWQQDWKEKRVGIVVSSLEQRHAVLRALQFLNPAQQAQLNQLQGQGFFVKQWEQLQGEVCDYLLVSTTHTKELWAPPYAARLVNVLATRATEGIAIFTSIPADSFGQYATLFSHKKMQDVAWFYAYLAYAQAVSQQEEAKRQAVLATIAQQSAVLSALPLVAAPAQQHFLDIIIAEAKDKYPSLHLVPRYLHAGMLVPLGVLDEKQQLKAVFYLDLWSEGAVEEGYAWGLFEEQYWQQLGIPCHRVWSVDWWKNREAASALLGKQLGDCLV